MATNKEILQWAQSVIDNYASQVQSLLGLQAVPIQLKLGNTGGDGAVGRGADGVITLNKDYFSAMDDPGGVIHEYVHVLTNAMEAEAAGVPGDVMEGIADYARWKLGLTYDGWTPSPIVLKLDKLDPAQVISLATQTSQGNWEKTWINNPTEIPQSGTTSYYTPTSAPVVGGSLGGSATPTGSTSTTGQWQFNGTPGDLAAMGKPKNWTWAGAGQPSTPNPATIFGGSASGVANPAVLAAAYQQALVGWGIPLDAGLQGLINHAANAGWSTSQFLQKFYTTPAFHQAFPGIFAPDGTLKMSPAQYLANQRSYTAYAQVYGVNLNSKQTAFLFQNNVSPQEFQVRAQALTILRTNDQYFTAFNQQLKQLGMQPLTKGEQFKFVMGEGNQEWYDLWQQSSSRYAGEQAGIHFGRVGQAYTNIGKGTVEKVAGLGLSTQQMQTAYANLAQQLNTTYPMSKIQKMGINKQDLVELEFGGPRQAAVAQKVQQVLLNEKAFLGNRANLSGLTPGLSSSSPRTQQQFAQTP